MSPDSTMRNAKPESGRPPRRVPATGRAAGTIATPDGSDTPAMPAGVPQRSVVAGGRARSSYSAGRLRVVVLTMGSLLGLAACSDLSASLLADSAIYATATACACHCYPYGSAPHTTPSATSTPTGSWVPPTQTPTRTPTRPPVGCDYCTLPPAPTRTPVAWPPPIITCTPRPDQPTLTPEPTENAPLFPTFPPNTPLPAVLGNTNPVALGSFEGQAQPGAVTTDPRSGQPYAIWSQLNLDAGQESAGRIYLKTTDPRTGQWLPASGVGAPGSYKIGKSLPESAVGVAPDGTVTAVYVHSDGDTASLAWRTSADHGASWSPPLDFAYPSRNNELYNVSLATDPAGQPHVVALVVGAGCDPEHPCGDLVYYERRADDSWAQSRRPVSAGGTRQYGVAVTTFALGDGTVRTVLGWNEDNAAYSAYKDGPAGAWSRPVLLIDGKSQPYGIGDYEPGFGGTLRLLPFRYGGAAWVYFVWSLYSTGRVCFVYSPDGGATWSGEDALAYEPITPGRAAHVGNPVPFFDPAHGQVLVIYLYAAIGGTAGSYPVYAYAPPGTAGRAWTGYEDPTHEPLRLFRPTAWSHAGALRGSAGPGEGSGPAYLLWREATGTREVYLALVDPATLFSADGPPPGAP